MNGISDEKFTQEELIREQLTAVFEELMTEAKLEKGDILVVGVLQVKWQVIRLVLGQVPRLERLFLKPCKSFA